MEQSTVYSFTKVQLKLCNKINKFILTTQCSEGQEITLAILPDIVHQQTEANQNLHSM